MRKTLCKPKKNYSRSTFNIKHLFINTCTYIQTCTYSTYIKYSVYIHTYTHTHPPTLLLHSHPAIVSGDESYSQEIFEIFEYSDKAYAVRESAAAGWC